MGLYIIQPTTPLWKDQMLHFDALMCNFILKHSHQCATGMQAGFLTLPVTVLLLDQVLNSMNCGTLPAYMQLTGKGLGGLSNIAC